MIYAIHQRRQQVHNFIVLPSECTQYIVHMYVYTSIIIISTCNTFDENQ